MLEQTAQNMAAKLLAVASLYKTDISKITIDNFNWYLDDAFNDGGEARCIHFVDLANPYALQFGPLESETWDNARWKCIERAIEIIQNVSHNTL